MFKQLRSTIDFKRFLSQTISFYSGGIQENRIRGGKLDPQHKEIGGALMIPTEYVDDDYVIFWKQSR